MQVKMVVIEGMHKGREVPLPETIFLIGRDRQCHLRPHCQAVSNLHCAIAAWAGSVRVRDLRSRNGTFLNGRPIRGEAVAVDGDQLRVGTLIFAFHIKNEDSTTRPAPIKDEQEVEWLLNAPDDSSVLSTECQTCILPAPAELPRDAKYGPNDSDEIADCPPAPEARGSKSVSAGKSLRDYFEHRKHAPRVAGLDLLDKAPSPKRL